VCDVSATRSAIALVQNLFIVVAMRFGKRVFFLSATLLLFFVCSSIAQTPNGQASAGRSNERVYNAPMTEVWTTCLKTANKHWKVIYANEANGMLEFRQGVSLRTNSWGVYVRVTVVKVDESRTKVALTSDKIDPLELSWARKDIAKKFFASLDTSFVGSSPGAIDSNQTSSEVTSGTKP
jgi:hypothetical protein